MALLRRIESYAAARRGGQGQAPDAEWVEDLWPDRAAGLEVTRYPLLVLEGSPALPVAPADVRVLGSDDPDLAQVHGAISVGFSHAGTEAGSAALAERDERAAARVERVARTAAEIAAGRTVMAGAFVPAAGAVGGGSHHPVAEVSEVTAVGVLPAYRRRGIAAALVARLATDALERGATTVFCTASDDAVARIYTSVGFRRRGTVCALPGA